VQIDAPVCRLLPQDPRAALPQLVVHGGPLEEILLPTPPDPRWRWHARYDLLASAPDDRDFVAEIDDDGSAQLRFGDGTLGRAPQVGEFFRARVRVGNGPLGNVGRDSIVWLVNRTGSLSGVNLMPRNPLPARGGTSPETLADAKLYAPGAFRAQLQRAITTDDYAELARITPGLQGAGCAFEWTGSWYEANVVVDPLGGETLDPMLARRVAASLYRYRRIGHDLAIDAARYVPLTIVVNVCVLPDFLTAHVEAELRDRFSSGLRRDGTPGYFHPDRLHLGDPVYVSRIVAEVQSVIGVAHAEVKTLARMDAADDAAAIASGVLAMAAREIAQVDGDPDYPEHGNITFVMGGGR
jgi:predicted phage baseplate assembly protein